MSDKILDKVAEEESIEVKDESSDAKKVDSDSTTLLVEDPSGVISDGISQQPSSIVDENGEQSVTEDSSVVVEESPVVAQKPCLMAEHTSVVVEEPPVVAQEPCLIAEDNSVVAEESSVVYQEADHSAKTVDDVDKTSEPDADEKAQRYECTSCSKSFARKNEYVKHQYIHRENPQMSCGPCSKGFTTELQLRRHNNAHHKVAPASAGARKQHICKHCAMVFRTSKALEQHHIEEHVSAKQYVCRVCGAEFSWEINLQRHELVHEVNPHSCRHCNREFVDQTSLRVHVRNVHKPNPANPIQALEPGQTQPPVAMLKRYVCPTCGRGFQFDFSYIAHMNAHVMPGQSTGVEVGAPTGYSLKDAVKRVSDMSDPLVGQPRYVQMNQDGVIDLGVMGEGLDQPGEIIVEIYDDSAGQTMDTNETGKCEEEGDSQRNIEHNVIEIEPKLTEIESTQTHVEIQVNARKLSGKNVQRARASERSPSKSEGSKTLEEVAAETVVKAKKLWSLKSNKNNNHTRVEFDVVVEDEEKTSDTPVVNVVNTESKDVVEPSSPTKLWSLRGKKKNGKVIVPEVVVEDEGVVGNKADVTNEKSAIVIEKSMSLRGASKKNNTNDEPDVVIADNGEKKEEKLNAEEDNGKKNSAGKSKVDKKSTVVATSKKNLSVGKNKKSLAEVAPEVVTDDEDGGRGEEMYDEEGGDSPKQRDDVGKCKQAKIKPTRGRGRPVKVKPVQGSPVQTNRSQIQPVQVKPVVGRPIQVKPVQDRSVQAKPASVQPVQVNSVIVGSELETFAASLPPHSELASKLHPRVNTDYNYVPARLMPKPKKPIRARQPFLFNCVMTPEKPFECQFCGETFRWEISLDIHTKIHTEGITPRVRKSTIQDQLDGKPTPPAAPKPAKTRATRTPSARIVSAGKLKSPPEVLESSIVDKHALSDEENHEDEIDEYDYPETKVKTTASSAGGRGRRARVEVDPREDVENEEDDPNDLAAYLTSGGVSNKKKKANSEEAEDNIDDDPNDLAAYLTSASARNSMKKKEERPFVGSSDQTGVRDKKKLREDVEGEEESLVRNSGSDTKAIKRRKIDGSENVASAQKKAPSSAVKMTAEKAAAPAINVRNTRSNTQQTPTATTTMNGGDKKVCDVFTADDFLLMMTDFGQKAPSLSPGKKIEDVISPVARSSNSKVQPAAMPISKQTKKNDSAIGNSSIAKKTLTAKKRGIANLKNAKKIAKGMPTKQGNCIPRRKNQDLRKNRKNFFKIVQWQRMQAATKRSAFPCSCGIVLSTKPALVRHRKSYHVPGVFACASCAPSKKKFTSQLALSRHRRRTHTGNTFECRRCGNVFRTNAELSRHRILHNPVKCPLVCKTCRKRYFVGERLERHEATHTATNGST